jgi:hypothetical protein
MYEMKSDEGNGYKNLPRYLISGDRKEYTLCGGVLRGGFVLRVRRGG